MTTCDREPTLLPMAEAIARMSTTITPVTATETQPLTQLLDLNMQGMDGLETLTQLRAAEVTSRIVMLTVSDADEDVIEAVKVSSPSIPCMFRSSKIKSGSSSLPRRTASAPLPASATTSRLSVSSISCRKPLRNKG